MFSFNVEKRKENILAVFYRTIASLEELIQDTIAQIDKRRSKIAVYQVKSDLLQEQNQAEVKQITEMENLIAKLKEFVR